MTAQKEKLTVDKAIEMKLTPIKCVQYYFPNVSDQLADYLIWEETPFPVCGTEMFLDRVFQWTIDGLPIPPKSLMTFLASQEDNSDNTQDEPV